MVSLGSGDNWGEGSEGEVDTGEGHQVGLELVQVPGGRDGGGVGQHAHATGDLGQVTTRNVGGGLIADAELEARRAPVDELDGALRLDDADGGVDILGDDLTTIKQSASHY